MRIVSFDRSGAFRCRNDRVLVPISKHMEPMPQHFTVDVEEYFHPTSLERWVSRGGWPELPRRAAIVIPRLLSVLLEHGTEATSFVLGWLAEREPRLVRSSADAGHEVASHGWNHRLVAELGPRGFREEARRSKDMPMIPASFQYACTRSTATPAPETLTWFGGPPGAWSRFRL